MQQLPVDPAHPNASRIASVLAVSALALGLSACGRTEDATLGQRTDAPALEHSRQSTVDGRTPEDSSASAPGAAVGGSAPSAQGPVNDAAITAQVSARLAQDPDLSAIQINVDTVNGQVTLNGPAPSTMARDRAEGLARAVTGVTSVNNQLVVMTS